MAPRPSAEPPPLLLLRLRPDLGAAEGERVEAELHRGREVLFRTVVDGAALALPDDLQSALFTYGEPPVELPAGLAAELAVLERLEEDAPAPLWLEFPPPAGLLPVLPWERLLGTVEGCRGRPVLRLPYRAVAPEPLPVAPRRVLLCAGSPAARREGGLAELVAGLAEGLAAVLPRGSEVHLFPQAATDEPPEAVVEEMERWRAGAPAAVRRTVHLHDPRRWNPPVSRSRTGSPRVEYAEAEPWLAWISDVLGSRPADAVHFVAHGYRNGIDGAVALAESPAGARERRTAQFLWPRELLPFLNRVGAWMVGFTALRPNYSLLGLRLLADRVARRRPGPVLLDEGGGPDGAGSGEEVAGGEVARDGLIAAWGHLLGDRRQPLPGTAGLRLQVHPDRLVAQQRPRQAAGGAGKRPTRSAAGDLGGPVPPLVDLAEEVWERLEPRESGGRPEGPRPPEIEGFEGEDPEPTGQEPEDTDYPGPDGGGLHEAPEPPFPQTAPPAQDESPPPTAPPAAGPPADLPRWRQVRRRVVEQLLAESAASHAPGDPLSAARLRGIRAAVERFEELLGDAGEEP